MTALLLLAQFAALAAAQFATEAFLYKIVQTVAQRFEAHVVDHFVDEGKLEQQLGFIEADATLAHVEQGSIVELAYGTAVGTLYIVGINLEHGLR